MSMLTRVIVCFIFCFSFYSCSSIGGQRFSSEKVKSSIGQGEDISYSDETITDDLDLIDTARAAAASPVVSDVHIRGAIVFRNCTFKGKVNASRKSGQQSYTATFDGNIFFQDCVFNEDVNMEGATMNGTCNFLNCTFKKSGLFNRSTLHGMTAFTKCTFMETGGFQQCTFMNSAYFNEAHFYASCFFQNSYFYRDATFSLLSCDGYTDFSLANFYSVVNCNYSHFKKAVIFNDATFRAKVEFQTAEFARAEFEGATFYARSIFDKITCSDLLTLKNAKFLTTKPQTTGYKAGKLDIEGTELKGAKMTEF